MFPVTYPMFQLDFIDEPFWMMVACCLVNKTTWRQADPVLTKMRSAWPTARDLMSADRDELYAAVRTLGFGNQRSDRLIKMAGSWVTAPPSTAADVLRMPGCGQYASDSWAIFVDGRTDVTPTDKELIAYLSELKDS